jgi:hypothetical protein
VFSPPLKFCRQVWTFTTSANFHFLLCLLGLCAPWRWQKGEYLLLSFCVNCQSVNGNSLGLKLVRMTFNFFCILVQDNREQSSLHWEFTLNRLASATCCMSGFQAPLWEAHLDSGQQSVLSVSSSGAGTSNAFEFQNIKCFGFSIYSHTSCMCSPLVM